MKRPVTGFPVAALTAENAELVRLLIPLRAKETGWIFKDPEGGRKDQAKVNAAFAAECRRLEIPARGIKDTFCSLYISAPGATWEWLSTQTGVAITTLKRHYAKTHREAQRDAEELRRIPITGEAPEKIKEGAA